MENTWVDFRQIIATISIEALLRFYGIGIRHSGPSQLRGNCPLPTHESHTKDSFTVSTLKDVWSCLSTSCIQSRGGRIGGNVIDLVSLMEGCSIRKAALKLNQWFAIGPSHLKEHRPRERIKISSANQKQFNPPLTFKLNVDSGHPYLRNRGINQITAKQFGLGYFSGNGCMYGRIVIPIHNSNGELIAYAGRTIDQSQPKYRLPKGFRKSLALFNFHIAKHAGKRVILVEGFFDCLKVFQAGFACVVALMGSFFSETQKQMITETFDHVILMLDSDEAGETARMKITQQLTPSLFVRSIILPGNAQPDQLSSQEIQQLLLNLTK